MQAWAQALLGAAVATALVGSGAVMVDQIRADGAALQRLAAVENARVEASASARTSAAAPTSRQHQVSIAGHRASANQATATSSRSRAERSRRTATGPAGPPAGEPDPSGTTAATATTGP